MKNKKLSYKMNYLAPALVFVFHTYFLLFKSVEHSMIFLFINMILLVIDITLTKEHKKAAYCWTLLGIAESIVLTIWSVISFWPHALYFLAGSVILVIFEIKQIVKNKKEGSEKILAPKELMSADNTPAPENTQQ